MTALRIGASTKVELLAIVRNKKVRFPVMLRKVGSGDTVYIVPNRKLQKRNPDIRCIKAMILGHITRNSATNMYEIPLSNIEYVELESLPYSVYNGDLNRTGYRYVRD